MCGALGVACIAARLPGARLPQYVVAWRACPRIHAGMLTHNCYYRKLMARHAMDSAHVGPLFLRAGTPAPEKTVNPYVMHIHLANDNLILYH